MGDQFLGRGFSSTPGNGHDGKGAAAKSLGRHVEQRLTRVVDHDDRRAIAARRWPLTENPGGAAFHRLRDEDVPIMLLASERHEQAPRFNFPRVSKEPRETDVVWAAQDAPTGRLDDLLHGHPHSITILAPLFRWTSWCDLPLGDQGAGDGFPDRGRDIGALKEDFRLARDHQHDELGMIYGEKTDERPDRLVFRISAVLRDARRPGLAGDPVFEAVDASREPGAMLDDAHHHLLHLLGGLSADNLTDEAWMNCMVDSLAIDHVANDVGPDQVSAGCDDVHRREHLDGGRIDSVSEGSGRHL